MLVSELMMDWSESWGMYSWMIRLIVRKYSFYVTPYYMIITRCRSVLVGVLEPAIQRCLRICIVVVIIFVDDVESIKSTLRSCTYSLVGCSHGQLGIFYKAVLKESMSCC
jgi:hypothetical protein